MSWIAFDSETPDKTQVLELIQLLQLPRPHILGALALTWRWFSEQTVLGLSRTSPGTIDVVSETPGFGAALLRVGWLRELPDGAGIEMPNFDRHTGSAHAARRKAVWRNKKRPETVPGQSQDRPTFVLPQSQSQSQRREEEPPLPPPKTPKRKKAKPEPGPGPETVPIPPELDHASFHGLWREWIEHRRRNDPMTARAAELALGRLVRLGRVAACEAIANSLEHPRWTSIYPPKPEQLGTGPTTLLPGLREGESAADYANRRARERAQANGTHHA